MSQACCVLCAIVHVWFTARRKQSRAVLRSISLMVGQLFVKTWKGWRYRAAGSSYTWRWQSMNHAHSSTVLLSHTHTHTLLEFYTSCIFYLMYTSFYVLFSSLRQQYSLLNLLSIESHEKRMCWGREDDETWGSDSKHTWPLRMAESRMTLTIMCIVCWIRTISDEII